MKKNLGFSDRLIRFVIIDLLLGASLLGIEVPLFYANLAFGLSLFIVLPIITAYSPVYHLLGISTINNDNLNSMETDQDSIHSKKLIKN